MSSSEELVNCVVCYEVAYYEPHTCVIDDCEKLMCGKCVAASSGNWLLVLPPLCFGLFVFNHCPEILFLLRFESFSLPFCVVKQYSIVLSSLSVVKPCFS